MEPLMMMVSRLFANDRLPRVRSEALKRAAACLLLALGVLLSPMGGALADDGPGAWAIANLDGDAWIGRSGVQKIALTRGDALEPGDVVTTGPSGRVVLRRGENEILVAPNSRMALPTAAPDGLTTRILQTLGTLLLNVEKKDVKHFEVETPFLSAVVKGTRFTVTVANQRAAVHVTEGLVEVRAPAAALPPVLVRPGQTARSEGGRSLDVQGAGVPKGAPAKTPDAADDGRDTASGPPSDTGKSLAKTRGKGIALTGAIDGGGAGIATASKGLLRAAQRSPVLAALPDAPRNADGPPGLSGDGPGNGGGNGLGNGPGAANGAGGGGSDNSGSNPPGNAGTGPPGQSGGGPGNSGNAPGSPPVNAGLGPPDQGAGGEPPAGAGNGNGPPSNAGGAPPVNAGGGAPPPVASGGPPANSGGGPPANSGGGPPANSGGGPPANGGGGPPVNSGGGPPVNSGGGPPADVGGGPPVIPGNGGGKPA